MARTYFGGRLEAWRKAAGLTQRELGERLGVTQQTVSDWESGDITPAWERASDFDRELHLAPGSAFEALRAELLGNAPPPVEEDDFEAIQRDFEAVMERARRLLDRRSREADGRSGRAG